MLNSGGDADRGLEGSTHRSVSLRHSSFTSQRRGVELNHYPLPLRDRRMPHAAAPTINLKAARNSSSGKVWIVWILPERLKDAKERNTLTNHALRGFESLRLQSPPSSAVVDRRLTIVEWQLRTVPLTIVNSPNETMVDCRSTIPAPAGPC